MNLIHGNKMKRKKFNGTKHLFLLYGVIGLLLAVFSCNEKEFDTQTSQVKIQLVYPEDFQPTQGIKVKLLNTVTHVVFESQTDENGIATFDAVSGIYTISTTESRAIDLQAFIFNGTGNLVVSNTDVSNIGVAKAINLPLLVSKTSQVVIKELYCGGCQKDDGSGYFQYDSYVILYNNSSEPATLNNVCLGIVNPYNSNGTNNDYVDGTNLYYEAEGFIPAGCGIWTFQAPVTLEPYQQIVIALKNAVDNTTTYKQSINFDNPDYYCTYDIAVFTNVTYYPSPAASIPTGNYLKAYFYGAGNAWTMSVTSPAFFVFETKDTTPLAWASDADNYCYYNNSSTAANARKKVPVDWIIDGVEVYAYGNSANRKRLTANVDAGYVELFNQYGFSLYRNVDQAATEAIPENEGKIVYNYSLGTQNITIGGQTVMGTTDPSGIDAEASIKNGAQIIYQDTNNSTNDFHQRSKASLRN